MLIFTNFSINAIMDSIIHPDSSFDFSTISLDNPMPLPGGSYFTKFSYTDKELPLYIQLSKCTSKNGIIKNNSTKKAYIDLQFNNHESDLLNFIENLEIRCRELIFEKKDLWFQSEISQEDIENMFIAPIKPYKSGKFYIIRANIPSSKHLKNEGCLIYDENERTLDFSYVNESISFLSLIHIEGIKFSSKCFQIEISVRQVMILTVEENIKNNCLIKSSKKSEKEETLEKKESSINNLEENKLNENIKDNLTNNKNTEKDSIPDNLNTQQSGNLEEINLDIKEVDQDEISIKKPNEVYIGIYKSAIEKAKQIKKAAAEAYLEAKKIKTKYNLQDIEDSDDELNFLLELEE